MSNAETDVVIYVTYTGTPDSRFDRTYYVERHMQIVRDAWQSHGLKSAAAFFPGVGADGTIAICELRFVDEAAKDAAFASPDAAGVRADVPNFTDLTPTRLRAARV